METACREVRDVLDMALVRDLLKYIRQRVVLRYGGLSITEAQFQSLYDGDVKKHIKQRVKDFYCGFSDELDEFTGEDWYRAYRAQYM